MSLKLLATLILELRSSHFLLDIKLFCLLILYHGVNFPETFGDSFYLWFSYILLASVGIPHSESNTHFILLSTGVEEEQNMPPGVGPQCLVF